MATTARDVIRDPEFLELDRTSQAQVLERLDPKFAGMDQQSRAQTLDFINNPDLMKDPSALRSFLQAVPQGALGLFGFIGDLIAPQVGAGQMAQDTANDLVKALSGSGIQAPRSTGDRFAAAAGRGVGESLPFLPLAGAGVGGELVAGASGELAATGAEELGAGPKLQFLASLLGGIGMQAGAGRAARGVREGASRLSPQVRERIARRRAGALLGENVPDRREAERLLREEVRDQPFGTQATTSQVLEEAAPGVRTLERSVAREVRGVNARIGEIKEANVKTLQQKFDEVLPGGDPQTARAVGAQRMEDLRGQVSRAYRGVGDVADVDISAIQNKGFELIEDSGEALLPALPDDVLSLVGFKRLVNKAGDVVWELNGKTTRNLSDIIKLEQRINRDIAIAVRAGDNVKVRFLNELKDSVSGLLDEVAEAGGSEQIRALQKAKNLRRLQGALEETREPRTGKKSPSRASDFFFGTHEDLATSFQKVLKARRPVEELNRIRVALGDDTEAWEGVQQLLRDEVFGSFDDLTGRTTRVLNRLNDGNNRAALDFVFGEGTAKNATKFVKRLRKVQSGVAGTIQESRVTGSNVADTDKLMADVAMDVASGGKLGLMRAAKRLIRSSGVDPTEERAKALVGRALVDPDYAAGLLGDLPAQLVPPWLKRVNSFTGNIGRSAAGTGIRGTERQ